MSAGPRIPYPAARDIAERLMRRWDLERHAGLVVGSVRRGKLDVGDIEFVCRGVGETERDVLCELLVSEAETDTLFGKRVPDIRVLSGLKRGFLSASLMVRAPHWDGSGEVEVPVQIHRWAADERNRGWITIMRTGPAEFGQTFLTRWKRTWTIDAFHPAGVEGHLVDRYGKIVPVVDEQSAFGLCGMQWVEPQNRGQVAARAAERSRR